MPSFILELVDEVLLLCKNLLAAPGEAVEVPTCPGDDWL